MHVQKAPERESPERQMPDIHRLGKPTFLADSGGRHILGSKQPNRGPTDNDDEVVDPCPKPLPHDVTPQNMQLSGGSGKADRWVSL